MTIADCAVAGSGAESGKATPSKGRKRKDVDNDETEATLAQKKKRGRKVAPPLSDERSDGCDRKGGEMTPGSSVKAEPEH